MGLRQAYARPRPGRTPGPASGRMDQGEASPRTGLCSESCIAARFAKPMTKMRELLCWALTLQAQLREGQQDRTEADPACREVARSRAGQCEGAGGGEAGKEVAQRLASHRTNSSFPYAQGMREYPKCFMDLPWSVTQ